MDRLTAILKYADRCARMFVQHPRRCLGTTRTLVRDGHTLFLELPGDGCLREVWAVELYFVDRRRVRRWFSPVDGVDLDPIGLLDGLAVAESAGLVLDDDMRPVEPVTRFLLEMAGEVSERTRRE